MRAGNKFAERREQDCGRETQKSRVEGFDPQEEQQLKQRKGNTGGAETVREMMGE